MNRIRLAALCGMLAALSIGWSSPDPSELISPVNMSVYENRLLVSDRAAGVHVFDVTDPAAPAHVYTIPLSGNEGNAVVGDVLFANDYRSLKAFHLGSESYVEVASFERTEPWLPPFHEGVRRDNGFGCDCADEDTMSPRSSGSGSTGSSYATFAVVGDYLYSIDRSTLVTISVADPLEPEEVGRTGIGWDVQTLHPAGDHLFMGGAAGMYIYGLDDPANPREIGRLVHARACDPVVVEGQTAYVTLRGVGVCGGARDVLLTVDISDPSKPALVSETGLTTPYGLAVESTLLYVSKGKNGFALFDVSAPGAPEMVRSWEGETRDFLWNGDVLYSMTLGLVRIFDVSDPTDPTIIAALD